jgi:hypothetical protein
MIGDALISEMIFYSGQEFETNYPYNQEHKNDARKVRANVNKIQSFPPRF